MPSIPERLATLEAKQKSHEEKNELSLAALSTRIEDVNAKVEGFAPVLAGINDSLATLAADKTARDAVAGDRRTRKMDVKDWILVAVGVSSVAAPLAGSIMATFQ